MDQSRLLLWDCKNTKVTWSTVLQAAGSILETRWLRMQRLVKIQPCDEAEESVRAPGQVCKARLVSETMASREVGGSDR